MPQTDSCTQQTASPFDHVVGAGEQCGRHLKAERFSGLEIDDPPRATARRQPLKLKALNP
jgi:hypothetical protein